MSSDSSDDEQRSRSCKAAGTPRVGHYQLGKPIGKGAFSVVRLGTDERDGSVYAVKIVNKAEMGTTLDEQTSLQREITLMPHLRHPHIARVVEVIETVEAINIIQEYVDNGDLLAYLDSHDGRLSEEDARDRFREIASAVSYIHSCSVVHRDIKLENIMVQGENKCKLVDFGLCNFMQPGRVMRTFVGTPVYAAPEVLQGRQYSGTAVDVWSMGVVLYALVVGEFPFDNTSTFDIAAVGNITWPSHLSDPLKHLLSRMLCVNPEKRLTVDDILQDAWLNQGYDGPLAIPDDEIARPAALQEAMSELTTTETHFTPSGIKSPPMSPPGKAAASRTVKLEQATGRRYPTLTQPRGRGRKRPGSGLRMIGEAGDEPTAPRRDHRLQKNRFAKFLPTQPGASRNP